MATGADQALDATGAASYFRAIPLAVGGSGAKPTTETRTVKRTFASLALTAATIAFGADFNVPQGGGKLPTIALIECLAEDGTHNQGSYCRTTYSCDGGSLEGVLVEGLLYHNGRRVTLPTDTIATERNCVIDVGDAARVQFFTGYRPEGPPGNVVAMVRSGTAASTVTIGSTTIPPENMLGQFLSHSAIRAATLDEWRRLECGLTDTRRGREDCLTGGQYIEGVPATERTACYVNARIIQTDDYRSLLLTYLAADWADQSYARQTYGGSDDHDLMCNELPN